MGSLRIVLLVLALPLAVADWWAVAQRGRPAARRVEAVIKPLVTLVLVGVAVLGDGGAARGLTVAALVLCLLGDVLLLPALDRFVAGLASFLLGHLLLVVAFVAVGLDQRGLGVFAAVAAAVLAATAGRRIVRGARAADPSLAVPVAAYLVVILAMLVAGWATGVPLVLAGATLFVLSDSLLGWDRFVSPNRALQVAVMVTYHAAIACLAIAV